VFHDAGSWLWNAGANIVQGLINGIWSQVNRVRDALRHITDMIPSWKGPEDVDRRLLVPSGRMLMSGLVEGITSSVPSVRKALGDLTVSLPAAAAPAAPTVNVAAPAPAQLDPRELARAFRDAIRGLAVQVDGYHLGRVQGDTADLFELAG
jgi:hypothetical protein